MKVIIYAKENLSNRIQDLGLIGIAKYNKKNIEYFKEIDHRVVTTKSYIEVLEE